MLDDVAFAGRHIQVPDRLPESLFDAMKATSEVAVCIVVVAAPPVALQLDVRSSLKQSLNKAVGGGWLTRRLDA